MLVSSLPEYNICMDYVCTEKDSAIRVRTQNWRDSMITAKADSIGEGLHKLFPEVSAQAFKTRLLRGRLKKRHYWKLYNKRVSYSQFQEVKKLPLFRESRNKSGFFGEPFYQRTKPFGSLAGRTLGEVDGRTDTARYGLELAFDTLLRGKWGSSHRRKVLDRYLKIIDSPQENGYDIVSTIDVEMQDVAEKALVDQLKEIDAPIGLAVLMEVSTGDVKAIVNMTRGSDGKYRETRNYAVSNLLEPGSVQNGFFHGCHGRRLPTRGRHSRYRKRCEEHARPEHERQQLAFHGRFRSAYCCRMHREVVECGSKLFYR